ncbi:hypothetical protein BC629DRAFT_1130955 [Irpex lacteus]|nr:hypothetical protein BC629DRAFT_1130955 [Irpex lacteus]
MSSFCLTIPPEPTAPSTFTSPVSTSAILDASNPTASRPSSTSIPPVDLHALASTATTADLYRRISELSTERMELNEASLARQRVLDAQREYLRRHEETRSAAAREKEQMDKLVDAVLDALQKTEKARERQEKRWAEDNLQLEKLLKAKAQDEEEEKRRKDEEARIQAQQEADAAAARKTQEELAERAARARKEAEEAKAREKAAAEKAARERREAEEAKAREKAAADKAAADKAAAEKAAAEKAAAEKSAAEKAAAEKAARERREVEEAKAREKEAAERATRARQEAEAAKARENEAAAARAKAAEEEAKAKEREKLEKIRQEREEKERLERLEAEARAKAEEVARARAEKLESDRMRAGLVAKTQAATAERVKKQAEERAKLPVAGASLDAAKSSNTAAPIKVEKEQAIARPPSAASTTSQRAPQPVITTTKAAAPPRLDVPLPSPAPTPALSRGSQHPLAAPGLVPHVSRPPTPAQQRTLANTSNGPQQSLPPTQPPTHIPALFQHPEDTVDVKPSLDVLQYPTPSASLPPTQTMDNIKTSPSMSSRKIQRSLWPPVSTPPTSSVSSQPTSSGPAHQPQIATPGIARVQSRDSSSQSGTARAAKPADSAPAYGVKPEPVEVPLPPQGTHKQTPHRVQQQTSSATTKATPPVASAVPPKHVPPIPRNSAVAQAPLAPVASLPAPVSLPPKPPLPPPPVTTRPQSTAAPVKAPIPATQNFNARNGDRSGRPPAPAGTNSTRNTIATRLDPVPPPNNSSARAAPSNQPHVAPPPWQEHDDDPWITDPRGRDEMDYHRERYPSPDRRADHWSPIRDHPPARQPFPVHSSHYQPLSPPRKRLHDSYPDDAPYKRPRFHERSRSPPPRRAFNGPDRAYTPPSPRYRSPRRTPSPSRYTPEPPVSPYASSVGSRRSYDWGPGPSAPHDRSYSPQQPRSRQLPARPLRHCRLSTVRCPTITSNARHRQERRRWHQLLNLRRSPLRYGEELFLCLYRYLSGTSTQTCCRELITAKGALTAVVGARKW